MNLKSFKLHLTQKYYLILFVIILIHTLILTRLIFFPYPEFFVYPYLTNKGLIPYKQIFDQHFPGLMFLPLNFNNLGLENENIARWYLLAVVALSQILIFYITYKIFKNFKIALLSNLLYLIWQPFFEGWVLWIDTFLPLFLLPAFYLTYKVVLSKKFEGGKIAAVGLLLSVALLFKQVILPLIGLVFLLLIFHQRFIKTTLFFALGFLPIPFLICYYFYLKGALADFWYWTVTFNLTTFAKFGRKPPFLTGVIRVLGVYSPILLLPLIKNNKLVLVLSVYILGSLTTVLARFDFVHFQPSLPFIIIATVAVFNKLWDLKVGKIALLGYLLVTLVWLTIFYKGHLGEKVLFFDDSTKQISSKIRQYANDGEEIYIFGAVPHLYWMSNTMPLGKIFVFQFPWFLIETEDKFLEVLQSNPPRLVVRDKSVFIEGNHIQKFAAKIDKFIQNNYETFDKVEKTEFMRRK